MTAAMVLPVGDVNPTHRRPFVTVLVLVANVAVFFLLQPKQGCAAQAFLFEWAAIPFELLTLRQVPDQTVAELIGQRCAATVADVPVIVTAFSAMFLHANVAHLLGNMLFLWVFGNNIEDTFGRFRYLAFYLAAGVAATLAFAVFNASSEVPLIGASGAVSAVLGAYLWIFPRARITALVPFFLFLPVNVSAKFILVMWFVLQILDGIGGSSSTPEGGGIAILAHIVGFAIGYFVARLTTKRRNAHYSELAT